MHASTACIEMLLHVHVNNILFLKTGATTPFIEMPLPLSQNMCIPKHVHVLVRYRRQVATHKGCLV